jgi:serine/threonine-protein kinase RsbW
VADPQGHRPWGGMGDIAHPEKVRDVVELRLPADPAYLSVVRTATAGLAARLDFTLDEIEDLRIAVDEACAMLLPDIVGVLSCTFEMLDDALRITVAAQTKERHEPQRGTFAWTVLTALAGEVEAGTDDEGRVTVCLHKRRGASG